MIFVSAEQSIAKEMADLFKTIYDGNHKAYPNGYMMLFILLLEGQQPTSEIQSKILFNHDQYLEDEAAFSIGGFQDLKSIIKLRNGKSVSLRTLIKSIPASTGMTRPQLFQHLEPNISGVVTMVTFQKQDSDHVYAWQLTQESEVHQVIADDEDEKVFIDNKEAIWFGGVNKMKTGRILASQQMDKSSLEYTNHITRLMTSPPPKTRGGILPSPSKFIKPTETFGMPTSQTSTWGLQKDPTIESKFADI